MRYEVVLRYGTNRGHEYVFANVRRENGAAAERDRMVAMTRENMVEHCRGGRVVQGAHPTDPNAVMVAALYPDGRTLIKVVTYREVQREQDLSDVLLASIIAQQGATF